MKKTNTKNKLTIIDTIKRMLSLCFGKKRNITTISVSESLKTELDPLRKMVHDYKDDKVGSETECRNAISESFRRLESSFTASELDSNYVWPKYLKLATKITDQPIDALVEFINRDNYIVITNHLCNLSKATQKKNDEEVLNNIKTWSKKIYLYILENINPNDVPSCLALGRMAQEKDLYKEAICWYERALSANQPFNAVTAILSCYEQEVKYLNAKRNKKQNQYYVNKQISEVNKCQQAVFTEWYNKMQNDIALEGELTDEYKSQFVSLATKYARFETHMGNYQKAYNILEKIPKSFPEIYRMYSEEAMLFQFKPNDNCYYDLEMAAEMFEKAEMLFDKQSQNVKGLKCILVPLANVYFRLSRYKEAYDICNRILEEIDSKEKNALRLKNRVAAYI